MQPKNVWITYDWELLFYINSKTCYREITRKKMFPAYGNEFYTLQETIQTAIKGITWVQLQAGLTIVVTYNL